LETTGGSYYFLDLTSRRAPRVLGGARGAKWRRPAGGAQFRLL